MVRPQPAPDHGAVLDALSEHVAVVDRSGTIVYVNRAWRRFGEENGAPSAGAFLGANYFEALLGVRGGADEAKAMDVLSGLQGLLADGGRPYRTEYACDSPSVLRWFAMTATVLPDGSGLVVSHADITERQRRERHALQLASVDPLTGLLNRRAFIERGEHVLRLSEREDRANAVLFVDVGDFRSADDRFGHEVGDGLLQQVALRLRRVGRRSDLVGRYGGDAFVVLAHGVDPAAVPSIGERYHEALSRPLTAPEGQLRLACSVGIAVAPDDARSLGELVRRADAAMYGAKGAGGGVRRYRGPSGGAPGG